MRNFLFIIFILLFNGFLNAKDLTGKFDFISDVLLGKMGVEFAGGTSSGGFKDSTFPLVCEFQSLSQSSMKRIAIFIKSDGTTPHLKVEAYLKDMNAWSLISNFKELVVFKNFYRMYPLDQTNQTLLFIYSSYPLNAEKQITIQFKSSDVDTFGFYSGATMNLQNIFDLKQNEDYSGKCQVDVVYREVY